MALLLLIEELIKKMKNTIKLDLINAFISFFIFFYQFMV